jgi:predicted phosphoribosyltransferase
VADGMGDGFALSVATNFLKSVSIKRVVVATPIASIQAVDRMHLLSDEICCLSVAGNFFTVDHYYEDNIRPDMKGVIKIMRNISINWDKTAVGANVYITPSRPYKY